MTGIRHLIIFISGCLGFLSTVLIDLDHIGSWGCKWRMFWSWSFTGCKEGVLKAGILHDPTIMLSLAAFFIMLGFGLIMHFNADMTNYLINR